MSNPLSESPLRPGSHQTPDALATLVAAPVPGRLVPDHRHALAPEVRPAADPGALAVNVHERSRLRAFTDLTRPDPAALAEGADLLPTLFDHALRIVAVADWLGGIDTPQATVGSPRELPWRLPLDFQSDELVAFLHAYPHLPLPDGASEDLWTVEDAGVRALEARLRARLAGDPALYDPDGGIATAALLRTIQSTLPEYLPRYDAHYSRTGGLHLAGLALRQIERFLVDGGFLGLSAGDLDGFTPEERIVLAALLLQRPRVLDPSSLLECACHCLLDPKVRVELHLYTPQALPLGTTLAQLGRTMALGGQLDLHAPRLVVCLPWDRTTRVDTAAIEGRLATLERLFAPAHVPVERRWQVQWAALGTTARLGACRLLGSEDTEETR